MSDEFQAPPEKFRFDEYWEMLKEYVEHPEARDALARYDAEYDRDQGPDISAYSESGHRALNDFIAVGWGIMMEHGWPSYREVLRHGIEWDGRNLRAEYGVFPRHARRLIRLEPGSPWPDQVFDVHDRDSMLRYVRQWSEVAPHLNPFTLAESD